MKRWAEMISGLAAMLLHVAAAGWFSVLAEINFDFTALRLNFILLSLAAASAYLINRFLIRRGVSGPLFAAVQLLLVAGGAFLFVSSAHLEPYVLRTLIISCVVYCTAFPMSAYVAYYGLGNGGMQQRFDIISVMIIILLVLDNFIPLPNFQATLMMCGAAMLLIIASQISACAGKLSPGEGAYQGNAAMGRLMLAGAFVFVALLTGVLAVLAFGGVENASRFIARTFSVAAKWLRNAFLYIFALAERAFSFIFEMLGGSPEYEAGIGVGEGGIASIPPQQELVTGKAPEWLKYIPIPLAAAAFIALLLRLRRHEVKKAWAGTVKRGAAAGRESGFAKALKGFFSALCNKILYRINCVRYRKTPAGLLVYCEKKAGKENRRRESESGGEFLMRLSQGQISPEECGVLRELADKVEKSFYSGQRVTVSGELYRKVKRLKLKKL